MHDHHRLVGLCELRYEQLELLHLQDPRLLQPLLGLVNQVDGVIAYHLPEASALEHGVHEIPDVGRIRSLPHVTVVDETARMLLVEAPEAELKAALDSLPDWAVGEEEMVP